MQDQNLLAVILASVFSGVVLVEVLRIAALRYTEGVKAKFAETTREREAARAEQARLDEAHALAATEHSKRVAEIYSDVDAIASYVLGPDVDYYDVEGRRIQDPLTAARRVVAELRALWSSHPTLAVRNAAKKLYNDMKSFYGEPDRDGNEWPSYRDRDTLLDHMNQAEALVELLHRPPARNEI